MHPSFHREKRLSLFSTTGYHISRLISHHFLIFRSIACYEGFMSLWAAALMTGLWNTRPSVAIGFKGVTKTLQLTRWSACKESCKYPCKTVYLKGLALETKFGCRWPRWSQVCKKLGWSTSGDSFSVVVWRPWCSWTRFTSPGGCFAV